MADLVLPCDHAALAAAVARLWPDAAAVAGVDVARVGVACLEQGGLYWHSLTRSDVRGADAAAADRALEELARSLEDAHYVVRRDSSVHVVVLGEAAGHRAREPHDPVRIADLPPWSADARQRAERLLAERQERDAATAPAANAKLEHARGL